jgi:hypothetical protein
MKLKDCTIGKVVCLRDTKNGSLNPNYGKPVIRTRDANDICPKNNISYILIGHVMGFDLNCLGETIVDVLWNDKTRYPIHPAQLIECEK